MEDESRSAMHIRSANTGAAKKIKKKSFRQLFSRSELLYYGIAAIIYISLGVIFKRYILNWTVGPGFIMLWMWLVPVLVDKWRMRR